MSVQKEFLNRGGIKLALNSWVPRDPSAVVVYIHGVQSHGGWLFDTGPSLATRKVATYVLDRRGCGLSEGIRGDVERFETWIEDYAACISQVRARHRDIPLVVLGQSMGGSLLAGVVSQKVLPYDALVFCAPAINQRVSLPQSRRADIEALGLRLKKDPQFGLTEVEVLIRDEQYTSDPKFLTFIKNDPLMTRKITVRASLARWSMEEFYLTSGKKWPHVPTAFVYPRQDSIINLDVARTALMNLTDKRLVSFGLPVDDHFIEFSSAREDYFDWLAHFAIQSRISA